MSEVKEAKVVDQDQDLDLVIKLSKEYDFEGEKITQIDLNPLNDITANDMIKANKILTNSGNVSVMPEMSLEYALVLAASATRTPVEFFKQLKPKDAMKVKNRVTSFLYGEE